jgi:hypothetical protein
MKFYKIIFGTNKGKVVPIINTGTKTTSIHDLPDQIIDIIFGVMIADDPSGKTVRYASAGDKELRRKFLGYIENDEKYRKYVINNANNRIMMLLRKIITDYYKLFTANNALKNDDGLIEDVISFSIPNQKIQGNHGNQGNKTINIHFQYTKAGQKHCVIKFMDTSDGAEHFVGFDVEEDESGNIFVRVANAYMYNMVNLNDEISGNFIEQVVYGDDLSSPESSISGMDVIPLMKMLVYIQSNFITTPDKQFFTQHHINQLIQHDFKFKITRHRFIKVSLLDSVYSFKSSRSQATENFKTTIKDFATFVKNIDTSQLFRSLENGTPATQKETISIVELPAAIQPDVMPLWQGPATNIQQPAQMTVLDHPNMLLLYDFEAFTGLSSLNLMRFYNAYLSKSKDNAASAQMQERINRTMKTWRNHNYRQPLFQTFPKISGLEDTEQINTNPEVVNSDIAICIRSYDDYGAQYVDNKHDEDWLIDGTTKSSIKLWIDNMSSSGSDQQPSGQTTKYYEFYPLLPDEGAVPGGGIRTKTYKRTTTYVKYDNKKHVIYTGTRGGRYIYLHKQYVSLNRLK